MTNPVIYINYELTERRNKIVMLAFRFLNINIQQPPDTQCSKRSRYVILNELFYFHFFVTERWFLYCNKTTNQTKGRIHQIKSNAERR